MGEHSSLEEDIPHERSRESTQGLTIVPEDSDLSLVRHKTLIYREGIEKLGGCLPSPLYCPKMPSTSNSGCYWHMQTAHCKGPSMLQTRLQEAVLSHALQGCYDCVADLEMDKSKVRSASRCSTVSIFIFSLKRSNRKEDSTLMLRMVRH